MPLAAPRFADFAGVVVFSGAGMSAESGVPTYRRVGNTVTFNIAIVGHPWGTKLVLLAAAGPLGSTPLQTAEAGAPFKAAGASGRTGGVCPSSVVGGADGIATQAPRSRSPGTPR